MGLNDAKLAVYTVQSGRLTPTATDASTYTAVCENHSV